MTSTLRLVRPCRSNISQTKEAQPTQWWKVVRIVGLTWIFESWGQNVCQETLDIQRWRIKWRHPSKTLAKASCKNAAKQGYGNLGWILRVVDRYGVPWGVHNVIGKLSKHFLRGITWYPTVAKKLLHTKAAIKDSLCIDRNCRNSKAPQQNTENNLKSITEPILSWGSLMSRINSFFNYLC